MMLNDVKCWGGTAQPGKLLDIVPGLGKVKNISVTGNTFCTITLDDRVKCWGSNHYGQMGNGEISGVSDIISAGPYVSGLSDIVSISAGFYHVCAVKSNGTIFCWGRNDQGQLGDSTNVQRPNPTIVPNISNAVKVDVGLSHTCALTDDQKIFCWGNDGVTSSLIPVEVLGVTSPIDIVASQNVSCIITSNHLVECWGDNFSGMVGNGNKTPQDEPLEVQGLSNVEQLSIGYTHICAKKLNGTIHCWGHNVLSRISDDINDYILRPQVSHGEIEAEVMFAGRHKTWG